jgi:hypothetical protein
MGALTLVGATFAMGTPAIAHADTDASTQQATPARSSWGGFGGKIIFADIVASTGMFVVFGRPGRRQLLVKPRSS